MAAPVLSVQELHKSFGSRVVFEGVSFSIAEGEKVGFIGANGSGKSTLFRIVAGAEGHESGELAFRRDLRVGYLPQEPEFRETDTILEAVAGGESALAGAIAEYHRISEQLATGGDGVEKLLQKQGRAAATIDALGGWDFEHRMHAVLTRLGIGGWERRVEVLSGGERKRVALARTLVQRPDLLLLDEPTNHLDADTTAWLEEQLSEYAGAVMLITHDRYFLDRVVERMIEVSRGELTTYDGGYTEFLIAKEERLARESVESAKRRKLIEKELEWVKRSPPARTGKQKARSQRLEGLRETAAQLDRRPGDAPIFSPGEAPRLGRTVLELSHLERRIADRTLIRDFSTQVQAGERIGIIGPNGAGKTTLVRTILGLDPPDGGEVTLGVNTRIAYFDQRRQELDPTSSVYEAVGGQEWVEVGGRRRHVRSYLEDFLFPPEQQRQPVRSLSGGERNRLLLAKLFLEEANVLILDEPTNDLDLVTLQVLEAFLLEWAGSVLVVTHDRFLLDKVATGLIVFEGEGRIHRHVGGYDLYRRQLEAREVSGTTEGAKKAVPSPRSAQPAARKLSYREGKELEAMDEAIVAAEAERDALAARLADPALYASTPDAVGEVRSAFQLAAARVDTLYARWEELEAIRAG